MTRRQGNARHLPGLWLLLFVTGASLAAPRAREPAAPNSDWLHVGGDAGGSRYSPLDQINRKNVWRLERAWTWQHGDLERFPEQQPYAGFHATPILLPAEAGGALVLCTPFNRLVALDPETGKERWGFDPQVRFSQSPARLKCLGVSYWRDSKAVPNAACAHRIFSGTSDRRLLAVDAITGTPCAGFGDNGQVDVTPLIAAGALAPADPWGVQFSAPPVLVNDVLVIGHINNMKNLAARAPSGEIRAFDARTGKFRWSFDPVPRNPADPQAGTWTPESLANTGGGNAWSLLSVDVKRDLVFVPTSSASPNWFGGTRPGDNRYANSVVALRGSTGKVVWHFQTVHHDVWDWDTPAQPMLVDIPKGGRRIPAVVVLTKQSLVFVLNRDTGVPLFPVEERPVPTDGIAGDVLSKTQPFPVKPPPLMKTRLTPDDAWGLTFWDQNQCRDLIASARHGEIFTPPSEQGWIMFPGSAGGMNWGGGAFDPARNLLVTNLAQIGLYLKLMPRDTVAATSGFDPRRGAPMGPPGIIEGTPWAVEQRILLGPTMMPCTSPPWSTLVGVDLAAGEIRWSVPLGTIDKLAPIPMPPLRWGAPVAGGPIVTAGGITLVGSTADARLRAYNTETGAEIWSTPLPSSAHANPMTYAVNGRQYVVIAAGSHMFINPKTIDDYLVAYALPGEYLRRQPQAGAKALDSGRASVP
ncbi:MAG: pyrroloquinoline quinone-dependent dehydrogenase [Gammaproteobacteria bacterium]|nr:pyrroloquinoline quinone-dependent dehydrogenase [Gammaproteobacteria bacterium]